MTGWSEAAGERLRAAVRVQGNQQAICDQVGVTRTSLNRYFTGTDPGEERLELLARAVGKSVEYLLGTGDDVQVVSVPIHDVQVAAGAGKITDRLGTPVGKWAFDRQWYEANFVGIGQIILVRVSGDSQEPELSNGDLVAVEIDRPKLREGMHVVRLDDMLIIKRIQMEGRQVRLVSRNPLYDPVIVDLNEPDIDSRFEVIGRAIWASKML
ncbi:S24 family peptidase [Sphingomonas sp. 1185]|uniref:XRE family transcriptional regulator n=1 Tax=Sphingomonas sp. 1185 TaxID=3156411 RepID=UPI0033963F16